MNPWSLNAEWLGQPWRLWTCHLVHQDLGHAALNVLALAVPLVIATPWERRRFALLGLGLAPLLSLALLPFLEGGSYCGLSGIVCGAWAYVAVRGVVVRWRAKTGGILILALLGAKCAAEAVAGAGVVPHAQGWQALPQAHWIGALLGVAGALVEVGGRRSIRWLLGPVREAFTFPRKPRAI